MVREGEADCSACGSGWLPRGGCEGVVSLVTPEQPPPPPIVVDSPVHCAARLLALSRWAALVVPRGIPHQLEILRRQVLEDGGVNGRARANPGRVQTVVQVASWPACQGVGCAERVFRLSTRIRCISLHARGGLGRSGGWGG